MRAAPTDIQKPTSHNGMDLGYNPGRISKKKGLQWLRKPTQIF